jgi:hypothetical protein
MDVPLEVTELSALVRFAETVQNRLKRETGSVARESLERDLKILKSEIGRRVLLLPDSAYPFQQSDDDSIRVPDSEILSLATSSPISRQGESISEEDSSLMFSCDDIGAKFDSFLKERKKKNSPIHSPTRPRAVRF